MSYAQHTHAHTCADVHVCPRTQSLLPLTRPASSFPLQTVARASTAAAVLQAMRARIACAKGNLDARRQDRTQHHHRGHHRPSVRHGSRSLSLPIRGRHCGGTGAVLRTPAAGNGNEAGGANGDGAGTGPGLGSACGIVCENASAGHTRAYIMPTERCCSACANRTYAHHRRVPLTHETMCTAGDVHQQRRARTRVRAGSSHQQVRAPSGSFPARSTLTKVSRVA